MEALLESVEEESKPEVLWTLQYSQRVSHSKRSEVEGFKSEVMTSVLLFPELHAGLSFDDSILDHVKEAWQKITGNVDGFMEFEDRETGAYDDE